MNIPAPTKQHSIELPETTIVDWPKFPDIVVNDSGSPRVANTDENLFELANYYGVGFRFNMMEFEPEAYEIFGDKLTVSYEQLKSKFISAASRTGLPKSAIDDHMTALCENDKYHPVEEWLREAQWDGVPRVEQVISCLNGKHKELANITLKHWLVGCLASIYEPTFKSKLVPVLKGEQSFKKTAVVERIAQVMPLAFLEGAELDPDNKDSVLACIRAWIVELGELERTNKNSQGSLKAFITKSIDTVRPPYARKDIKKPRQTHFIATVNGKDFLKDETGSSRFFVLEMTEAANMEEVNRLLGWQYDGTGSTKQVNPELLKQFWLEVKVLYESGYGWMLSGDEIKMAGVANESFNDKGSWYDYILGEYLSTSRGVDFSLGWFSAGELVSRDANLSARETRLIGKALAQLERDGFVDGKIASGNRKLYYFREV
jgi:predicted P-loop ATPase